MQYRILFILLMMSGFIFSCQRKDQQENLHFFRYNQSGGIKSLDPKDATVQSTIWACNHLYNGLVQLNEKLEIKPSIAYKWEISADGFNYTFHLRPDVFFHDHELFPSGKGRKVTASDFVYSFSRIQNPSISPDANWVFAGKVDSLNPFEAPDDSTFIIHLKKTFPPFLSTLSTQICSVVPHEVVDAYGNDFGFHPVGTGPFYFKAWREGEVLVLLKNDHYFEKDEKGNSLPYLHGIRVTFIDSKSSEFLSFRQKQIDLISDIDPAVKDEVLTKEGDLQPAYSGIMKLQKMYYLNTEYIGFNLFANGKLVDDAVKIKEFRRAINYGINKEKLITYLRNGVGIPAAHGFVPYGLSGFETDSVKGYCYDPMKAKELIGKLKNTVLTIYCSSQNESICTFIASDLSRLGMTVNVNAMQSKTVRQMNMNNELSCFRASWIADYPDAESFLSCFYSHYGAGPNYTRFKNPTFDQWYDQAAHELNDTVRNKIYMKMDSLVMEAAAIVPLFYDQVLRFIQPEIKGLTNNALNLLDLKRVYKE